MSGAGDGDRSSAGFWAKAACGPDPGSARAPRNGQGGGPTARVPAARSQGGGGDLRTGPITVHRQVSDREIERFLAKFLPKYPGVRNINVAVDDGVVTLQGRVDDDDSRDEITDVVKRVEGVRLVLNQMDTDEEVMTGLEFAEQELGNFRDYFARKWILILMALAIVAASWLLAQFFASRSETLLAPSCTTSCCGRWSARSSARCWSSAG